MFSLIKRHELLTSIVLYLDKRIGFKTFNESIIKNNKDQLVYSFEIDIDLGHILDHDANLGNCILKNPLESIDLFQEVIFLYFQSHSLLPFDLSLSQIFTHLKIKNFPSFGLEILDFSDLIKFINYKGFVKLVGVVTGLSGFCKYTQSTKYICPVSSCLGHSGNHYIRMHVSGAVENQIIRNDFTCIFCGEVLEEVISLRNLSDKIVVELLPLQIVNSGREMLPKNICMQSIAVILRDNQINSVELGQAYEVIGTCHVDGYTENISFSIEANNVIKLQTRMLFTLPPSSIIVEKLNCACNISPWTWPYFLAHKFGANIVPGGYMIKFRLLHLISIVLNPELNLLNILCIGKETSLYFSLVEFTQKFAQRSYLGSGACPVTGQVIKGKHSWAPFFLQGGSLLLSCGGVCSLGNISEWKKTKIEQLQTVLTTSKIFLDLTSKHTGGLAQQPTFPLRCQVWAVQEHSEKDNCLKNAMDILTRQYSTGDLSKTLMDAFSYICFLDSEDPGSEEELARDMVSHLIAVHTQEADDQSDIPIEEIDQFLALARHTDPKMSPEAEDLLQSYYRTSRMTRSSGFCGSHVPPSAVPTLNSLAVGLAKLKLSDYVGQYDAVMAIFLYEEYLSSRFGQSCFNCQPQHHISYSMLTHFFQYENDLLMKNFSVQLLRFCSTIISTQRSHKEE